MQQKRTTLKKKNKKKTCIKFKAQPKAQGTVLKKKKEKRFAFPPSLSWLSDKQKLQ